ncbi:MAG TPA: hypothetical protein VG388_00110 [Solirubrobacteraceae bacterium]|nr:hypothetical protein [Solirubrobacteraceae bacterium]
MPTERELHSPTAVPYRVAGLAAAPVLVALVVEHHLVDELCGAPREAAACRNVVRPP